jgi:hypothetical protein
VNLFCTTSGSTASFRGADRTRCDLPAAAISNFYPGGKPKVIFQATNDSVEV